MRFVVIIPVLVLFLSNVPFVKEMPMEEMMAMMQREKKCCKKEAADRKGSCHPETKPAAPAKESSEECCQRTETTCHCICCFQFAAPAHETDHLQFGLNDHPALRTGFVSAKWNDPHINLPEQPPDLA